MLIAQPLVISNNWQWVFNIAMKKLLVNPKHICCCCCALPLTCLIPQKLLSLRSHTDRQIFSYMLPSITGLPGTEEATLLETIMLPPPCLIGSGIFLLWSAATPTPDVNGFIFSHLCLITPLNVFIKMIFSTCVTSIFGIFSQQRFWAWIILMDTILLGLFLIAESQTYSIWGKRGLQHFKCCSGSVWFSGWIVDAFLLE